MNLGGLFDLTEKKAEISRLEQKMSEPNFWDDSTSAQQVIDESNWLKNKVESFESIEHKLSDAEVLYEMLKEDEDEELVNELQEEIKDLQNKVESFEIEML